MVKVQFPGSAKIVTIKDAQVVHQKMNMYHVTIPLSRSVPIKEVDAIKFWINNIASFDAKLINQAGIGGKTVATFVVLLGE
jgi:hypothetical protein